MKIACIVVTYNRLDLLIKCIEALREQTYKDFDILVINNGSTDNTLDWLSKQEDLSVLTQENLGGAGGFHNGMKKAYLDGYDWLWIMDDDGIPSKDCLLRLIDVGLKRGFFYVAPNLIDFHGEKHFDRFLNHSPLNVLDHCGGPFNAILLNRYLIEQVGLPNKYYFIWGDEYEYVNRLKEAGFHTAMVRDAIHFHKKTEQGAIFNDRIFFKIRNYFWTYRLSLGLLESKKLKKAWLYIYTLKLSLFYLSRFRFKILSSVIRGIKQGLYFDLDKLRTGGDL